MSERVIKDFSTNVRQRSFADIMRNSMQAKPVQPNQVAQESKPKQTVPVKRRNDKLSDTWVLWSHHINEQAWDIDSYTKICDIKFDDDFEWLCQNFPPFEDYILYLMRTGIEPIWEDPKNRNGGCYSFKVSKLHYKETWEELSRALICDYICNDIEDAETITGISINPRTNTIKIWNNDKNRKEITILNKCVKWINYNGVIYKPHEIDESRKKEKGYKTDKDNTDPNKSDESKIEMINRKMIAMISKLVKSNVTDFRGKMKKLEELFGRAIMYKVCLKYPFVCGENENDYIYAKYKLQILGDLETKVEIYKGLYDSFIDLYKESMSSIPRDKDISAKNIAELDAEGKQDEIDDNIKDTRIRNRVKELSVFIFNMITKKMVTDEKDLNDLLDMLIQPEFNPMLMLDGPIKLLIAFKSRINKDHFSEKLSSIISSKDVSRKIRFAIEDIIKFLNNGDKNQTVKEIFEIFDA